MAGASDKKLAAANTRLLNTLHQVSLGINVVALVALFVLHRPQAKKAFFLFSIPLVGCEYAVERFGRPLLSADGRSVVSAGADLSQAGVTEWLFDVIYFTLALDVLMVVLGTNKVWWLWLALPAFAVYKSMWLIKAAMGMVGGLRSTAKAERGAGAGASTPSLGLAQSKRSVKMAAKREKAEKSQRAGERRVVKE